MNDPVRVKICGLTRIEDAHAAAQAGADYLGFVLVPESRRSLAPEALAGLRRRLDPCGAKIVGVFRDQPAAWINDVVRACGLDHVQLHGHEPRDFAAALAVPVLRVLRVAAAAPGATVAPARAAARLDRDGPLVFGVEPVPTAPNVFAILLDAEDASGASGGLGRRPEDAALVQVLESLPAATRVFLSGGLTPENVAAVVRAHRPFAVDVSSGVEARPGEKDPARIAAFVAAARGAS